MSAPKEIKYSSVKDIKRLGIVAGGGYLPSHIAKVCSESGIDVFVAGIDGQADLSLLEANIHVRRFPLGQVGKMIAYFKENGVNDLVLIGGVHRPALSALKPDFKGVSLLSKLGFKALGDNDLLVEVRKFLEKEGFSLHGAHRFADDLLVPAGVMGNIRPTSGNEVDIDFGISVSQFMGKLDVGQAVVVQEGIVLGVEAVEGTDALIKRCASLKRPGRGGVLVKTCKPQQDRDLDLPTVGLQTIENAHAAGLSGLALHAGELLMLNQKEMIEYADQNGMFIIGVNIKYDA